MLRSGEHVMLWKSVMSVLDSAIRQQPHGRATVRLSSVVEQDVTESILVVTRWNIELPKHATLSLPHKHSERSTCSNAVVYGLSTSMYSKPPFNTDRCTSPPHAFSSSPGTTQSADTVEGPKRTIRRTPQSRVSTDIASSLLGTTRDSQTV